MDIQGGVAIVTGSSSGVGAACARQLAERGCNVVINYSKSEAGARETEAACRAYGVETLVVRGDVANDADCRRLAASADEKWGRIDALVNNAGTTKFCAHNDLEGLSKQDFLDIYSVNTVGAFQMTRAVQPAMKRGGRGSIVNVASIRSVVAGGNMVQYDTTKAAVAGLTRAMALDHAADGIRVNAVCPGPIFTRFHERRAEAAGRTHEDFRAEFGRGTMLGRAGTPAEVAACILFLASDDASYVTGASLYVDGGHTAR